MTSTQPPEGKLMENALKRTGESARTAAAQVGISDTRLRQIISGHQPAGPGQSIPVVAPAATLARMAKHLDVSAEDLEGAGRKDAAESLRELWAEPDKFPEGGLELLIQDNKGDRSYRKLASDCRLSEKNVQHRATHLLNRSFPDAATIKGLARGLNVTVTRVVLASAISLGLPVKLGDESVLELPGAGRLPRDAQDLLVSMSMQLQNAHRMSWGVTKDSHWVREDHDLAAGHKEPGVSGNEPRPPRNPRHK